MELFLHASYSVNTPPSTAALSPPPLPAADGEKIRPIAKGLQKKKRRIEQTDGPKQSISPLLILHVSHSMVLHQLGSLAVMKQMKILNPWLSLLTSASYCSQAISPPPKNQIG
ncbi:hypothetical protein XENORESO_017387 [Xenotaenia resolanae]|uniref:Uncharacterized protein n=1 Tax=Xenotaenia resolanae TaxID=208358 RepID=A0ABV0VY33_9TELE